LENLFGETKKKVKAKTAVGTFPQKTKIYTAKTYKVFLPIIALHTVVEKNIKPRTSQHPSRGKACGNGCKQS
jgi:hypothetical protein